VLLWARSDGSADRARASVEKICGRLSGEANAANVKVATDLDALATATVVVEAVVEEHTAKASLLADLGARCDEGTLLATTTSSLSVTELAAASGRPEQFAGLHVFNPVTKMKLVELAFPTEATEATRERARALCIHWGKTAVEVPDRPGFVVNRLLFPYLFSAVRFQHDNEMSAEAVDSCMTLGAGHPMGPLALLDFVGLDVAQAIGEAIGEEVPARVRELVAEGALGRKSGRGFYDYGD